MGGKGSWELAMWAKQRASSVLGSFRGLSVCCGFLGNRGYAADDRNVELKNRFVQSLAKTPVWAFHSADDYIVPVEHSDRLIGWLQQQEDVYTSLVKYTRYETAPRNPKFGEDGGGHACYEIAWVNKEFWAWMNELAGMNHLNQSSIAGQAQEEL